MLKENEIEKIADKLGWSLEETKLAIKEFRKAKSITNCDGFLRTCADAINPQVRWQKVVKLLFNSLKGDLVKTITDLLYNPDSCFYALAVFNAADIGETIRQKIFWYDGKKSFLKWDIVVGFQPAFMKYRSLREDPRLSPYELCDEFLDAFVKMKQMTENVDLKSLLLNVVAQAGLLAFNIKAFRFLASGYIYDPTQRDKLTELGNALYDPLSNRTKITERRYWLIYVLVEKLKGEYGVRGAFREVAKLLNTIPTSIQTRYFEMKKKAKKQKLALDDIIGKYHLSRALTGYLEKSREKRQSG